MNRLQKLIRRKGEKGQSLVEVALFFPIFVIILAGLVEVSQIVVDQNRVSNAARTGARFMANGGTDTGMVRVSLDTMSQTLRSNLSRWDIWSIRGQVDDVNGTTFVEWEFEHVHGISNTKRFSQVVEAQVQQDVLTELQSQGNSAAQDVRIVGTLMLHDFPAIIGINALPGLANINSVRALSVMRITGFTNEDSRGCNAFPIALNEGIRSVNPVGSANDPFPTPSEFGPGSPRPLPVYTDFTYHVPDVDLVDAEEGYVYKIQNGFGSGNFGWLVWNVGQQPNATNLNHSLSWPGDSADYRPTSGQIVGGSAYPFPVRGYIEPNDPTDDEMHVGDWVMANTGQVNSNANRVTLADHAVEGRQLRVLLWDQSLLTGSGGMYHIQRFAIFQLHGFNLTSTGGGSWILAEFIRWDDSCGQLTPIP